MDESANRLLAVFAEAAEIADANARKEYLAQVCGTDQTLLREIEQLLAADERAGGFLPSYPSAEAARAATKAAAEALGLHSDSQVGLGQEKPGDRIGRYRLIKELGHGGCGVVYEAEQEVPVRRPVALKIIKLGMDTRQVVARFELERQALALMDHPNIAKVFDAGATESGRPFFVMELVDGVRITDYCKKKQLGMSRRLELFIRVCQAVQHAHQKGVIHRDLKPSNILVAVQDGQPVPKVIDFGIAKATEGRLTGLTSLSAFEQFLGTPAYMSPEQAALTDRDVDTRSDIYSLGVLLYELLTGTTPFDTNALLAAGLDELRRTIREKEPLRPSARLSTDLASMGTRGGKVKGPPAENKPAQLQPRIAARVLPDTKDIIKLVRGDLDWIVMKCLEKDRTRRYETANGLANDIQRHLNHEPVIARPPSRLYEFQKTVRRHKVGFAATAAVIVSLVAGILVSVWQAMQKEAERQLAQKTLVSQYVDNGSRLMNEGDLFGSLLWYAAALNLDQGDPRREEPHRIRIAYVLRQCPKLLGVLSHGTIVYRERFSTDGTKIITCGADRTARVWDGRNGQQLVVLHHQGEVNDARFSPDGLRIITASADRTARIWDSEKGTLLRELNHENTVWNACFNADSGVVATACENNKVQLWDGLNGESFGPPLVCRWRPELLDFSPDGRILGANGNDQICLWDVSTRQIRLQTNSGDLVPQKFSPDSKWLLTDSGAEVHIWSLTNFQEVSYSPLQAKSDVHSVSFSPDSRTIIASGNDSTEIWDARSGQPRLIQPIRHDAGIDVSRVSPDGRVVATGGHDERVQFWSTYSGQPVAPPLKHSSPVYLIAFNPDGHSLVANSCDRGAPRLWDLVTSELDEPCRPKLPYERRLISPDGKQALVAEGNTVWIVETATGRKRVPLCHTNELLFASFNNDGHSVITSCMETHATSHHKNHIFLWDAATGRQRNTHEMAHPFGFSYVAFSQDAVLTCGADCTARLWGAHDGRRLGSPMRHSEAITWAAFSPNSASLVTASADRTARVWDTKTCQPLTPPLPHRTRVVGAFWSKDGKRLHTVTEDDYLQVWDLVTGEPLTPSRKLRPQEDDSDSSQPVDEPLPLDTRPVADLVQLAELLDLARIDENGKVLPLELAELSKVWESLRRKYPEQFATKAAEIVAWHRRQAEQSRSEANVPATLFHLNQALDRQPDDKALRNERDEIVRSLPNSPAQTSQRRASFASIPRRSVRAGPEQLDLARHYTASLRDSISQQPDGDFFRELSPGLHIFGGVCFDVRGAIYLNGQEARKRGLANPVSTDPIPVGRKCHRLHFLQTAHWGNDAGDTTQIGSYILHFADGQTRELPIVEGADLRDLFVHGPPKLLVGRDIALPVWLGLNTLTAQYNAGVCLFKSTRAIPLPDTELVSLQFVSSMSPASPILLAITVE